MSILLKYKKQRNEEFNKFIEPAIDKGFDGGSVDIQALQRQRIAWREDIKHFHNETIDGVLEEVEKEIEKKAFVIQHGGAIDLDLNVVVKLEDIKSLFKENN